MDATNLRYDGLLDIATGRSRKETHWRNGEVLWSSFVSRLSTTHRTAETLSQYLSAKKTRQDEIKDVGGYVGGYVNGGRRKPENITHRCLITLDLDFAKADIWEDYSMLYDNAAVLYSTHKHAPDNPRFRLILPIDRPVGSDEYVAIARRIAGNMGVNYFDDTTFQPERLMYWPSSPKDGEYVFEFQDGPFLCADSILASYRNWRDASQWPVSDRAKDSIHRDIKKQGDPLEKPGLVGAFCRAYNIHEAIETYLNDVYEACDVEDRYTYREGSTSAGLITYDDKYAFSHHGTDPTSGKLCNAFDLVRIHLYGLKDEDANEGTPSNKLPSYLAMSIAAGKDAAVRKIIGTERMQAVMDDFAEAFPEEDAPDTDWVGQLDVDLKGAIRSTSQNIRTILDNDPLLKGKFAKNAFEKREIATGNLPWRGVAGKDKYLCDVDDAGLRDYLETIYSITGVQKVKDALDLTVQKNAFHPLKDYLESLVWDGTPRVDTLLVDYLGAEDSPYTRAVTRKTLCAAIARVYRPGMKFDYVLTLVGSQGVGKSTFIKKLGGEWYSDSFSNIQGKEAFEQIQGVWLLEMGELAGLKKAEMETIKHFISKQEDRYRVAYGRRVDNFPRQCIFFGTTNNLDFLRDPTGNRRFWPVTTMETPPTMSLWDDMDPYQIGQIWAEAIELYNAGEALYLDKELEEYALRKQYEHCEVDDRTGIVQEYLNMLLPENWPEMDLYARRNYLQGAEVRPKGVVRRNKVCVAEIWCELFGRNVSDMNAYNTKDIHTILQSFKDWERRSTLRFDLYGIQRGFVRKKGAVDY